MNVFESEAYMEINRARDVWVRDAIRELGSERAFSSALDLGCGGGFFSQTLSELGFNVTGLDARPVNIERCKALCPNGTFRAADLDTPGALRESVADQRFDLGFVFGLLYHLIDPVRLIRDLDAVIDGVCLVSTRCAAGDGIALHAYDEFDGDAHSERRISMVPTRDAYIWAFRDAGWSHLYELETRIDHPQWDHRVTKDGLRFTFVASRTPIHRPRLTEILDTPIPARKWERDG